MDNDDLRSMPYLIMQYKPYIVEQSYMGATRSFICVKRQQAHMSTMFISEYKLYIALTP